MPPKTEHTGGKPKVRLVNRVRVMVTRMAEKGLRQEDVAYVLGISEPTLQRRLADEFKAGVPSADDQVVRSLFQMATSGKVPGAAIFWTKARLGWSEKVRVEMSFAPIMEKLTTAFLDILHRAIPDFCPHCRTALQLKPAIGKMLMDESSKLSGAAAAQAAAQEAASEAHGS